MRLVEAILPACLICSCSASPRSDEAPVGLTCTSRNGATIRLNLDLAAGTFQKEGFPKVPIAKISAKAIVLLRQTSPTTAVVATIDRGTLVYTAEAEDRVTRQRTRMDYPCLRGEVFAITR